MAMYQTLRRKRPSIQMSLTVVLLLAIPVLGYVAISAYAIIKKDNQLENLRHRVQGLEKERLAAQTEHEIEIRELQRKIEDLEERVKILDIIEEFKPGSETSSLDKEESRRLAEVIQEESKRYGYDPLLIMALIATESSFQTEVRSKVGATGLMQVMPRTGREIADNIEESPWHEEGEFKYEGSNTLKDPIENIRIGAFHLARLIIKFGDVKNGIRAYNQGETNISARLRKGQRLPRVYLRRVMSFYESFQERGDEVIEAVRLEQQLAFANPEINTKLPEISEQPDSIMLYMDSPAIEQEENLESKTAEIAPTPPSTTSTTDVASTTDPVSESEETPL